VIWATIVNVSPLLLVFMLHIMSVYAVNEGHLLHISHLRLQPEPPAKVVNQSVLCTHSSNSASFYWDFDRQQVIVASENYLAAMQRLAMHAAGVRASAILGPRQVRVACAQQILAIYVVRPCQCDTYAALPMLCLLCSYMIVC